MTAAKLFILALLLTHWKFPGFTNALVLASLSVHYPCIFNPLYGLFA